jgi:hypothetical protein
MNGWQFSHHPLIEFLVIDAFIGLPFGVLPMVVAAHFSPLGIVIQAEQPVDLRSLILNKGVIQG